MNSEKEDLNGLKNRLKQTWTAGDYGVIARGLERSAEEFLARASVQPGERLLDVACGAGQVSIPAARNGVEVTGIDIAENWIAQARARAENEGLSIRFDVGDAEDMPYTDDAFDVVISLIGAMFAPRPDRATAELVRVCRPGGRIVMGNWTPEGFIGDFFKTVGKYAPPPDMPSPLLWGDEATVQQRLGPSMTNLKIDRRHLHFDYPMPPLEVADLYLEHFGPTKKAAESVSGQDREALRRDLERLWAKSNQASDGTTQVDAEILEVVGTRGY